MADFLPGTSTPFEFAVDDVSEARWAALDADIIRRSKDPMRAPAHLLNFLAFELSADIWDERWPDWKKRLVVSRQIRLHRLKGTLAGLREYAEIAESEVTRAIVPPGTFLLSATPNPAELEVIKLRMPQIRIYQKSERFSAGRRLHFGAGRYSLLGRQHVADSGAGVRSLPRAVFADQDIEQPIDIEEILELVPNVGERLIQRAIFMRPRARGIWYLGHGQRFMTVKPGDRSTVSFRRVSGATSIIGYGLKAASVDPEPFFVPGRAGRAYLAGRRMGGYFLSGTNSGVRTYERIIIWDPSRLPASRKASFLGVSRFGVAPYKAELFVDIPGRRARRSMILRGAFIGGHFVTHPRDKYESTIQALRSAKAARDSIQINTTTYRSPVAGNLIVAGTPFIAGKLLRS